MKTRIVYFLLFLFAMLLCGCNVATTVPTTSQPEIAVTPPVPTIVITIPTITPTSVQDENAGQDPLIDVNVGEVAREYTSMVIAAVPATENGPYWEAMPQYTTLTMTGYPIDNHLMKPQIFIYPVNDLMTANEVAGQIVINLQSLLQNQLAGEDLPFLPMFNSAQMLHAQVKYLDFENGKGVRYLTQFAQGIVPVNNYELIYTYQGLTNDGKYYVAVVLPINLASLPADEKVTGQEPPEFSSDYLKYLDNLVNTFNQQSPNAFTPDLSKLDAMVQSIEIK